MHRRSKWICLRYVLLRLVLRIIIIIKTKWRSLLRALNIFSVAVKDTFYRSGNIYTACLNIFQLNSRKHPFTAALWAILLLKQTEYDARENDTAPQLIWKSRNRLFMYAPRNNQNHSTEFRRSKCGTVLLWHRKCGRRIERPERTATLLLMYNLCQYHVAMGLQFVHGRSFYLQ